MNAATLGDALRDHDADLVHFRARGVRWIAERAFEPDLREVVVPGLGALGSAGATLVKRTVTRSVWRLEVGGVAIFIKHHRLDSLRERLKYLLLPSRAAAEWNASRTMAERGIPAAGAVAFGERRVAGVLTEAVLITAEAENALPLTEVIKRRTGAAAKGEAFRRKRALLAALARFVRKAHDAGVRHRDLHGGNILVSGEKLLFIDLHRVDTGGAVSRRHRVAGVAQLLGHLGGLVTSGDRLFFVREYLGADAARGEVREFARRTGRIIVRLRERRYASRTKRCVKRSTGFRREHGEGLRVRRRADFPLELVLRAVEQHKAQSATPAGDGVLKWDERARVSAVKMDGEHHPRALCVKEFIRPGVLQRIGDLFRGSRAKLAWLGANGCAARGILTPKALAMAEAGPRSFFITELVDGTSRFSDYAANHERPRGAEAVLRWRGFIRQAADFVRRIHSHRLRHLDLSGKNILVREHGGGWEFYLVDVGDIRFGRPPSLPFRIKNLGQLDDVYAKPPRTDRLRFYRSYSRGMPELNRREYLTEIDATSRARHEHWLESDEAKRFQERQRLDGTL